MRRVLEAFARGDRAPAHSTWAEGSKGSGGAVRVVPVACAYHDDVARVAALAEEVAGLTHAHPHARAAAVVHALALAIALESSDVRHFHGDVVRAILRHRLVSESPIGAKMATISDLLDASSDGRAAVDALGNGVLAEEAVPLALFSFLRWAPDFEAVVSNAIRCGGDTDTIGAMSGALVGEGAIPIRWIERLEGAEYLRTLADATFALRGRT
jgi:poly(ADP-ribose) glycohydrolase ARH3